MPRGFTLIELLVVVAIISVLAGIAMVNYLEAQTRAKITQSKADFYCLAQALETYRLDNSKYPLPFGGKDNLEHGLVELTSPIAYVQSLPRNPFPRSVRWGSNCRDPGKHEVGDAPYYKYFNFQLARSSKDEDGNSVASWMQQVYDEKPHVRSAPGFNRPAFLMSTVGPSKSQNVLEWYVLGAEWMTGIEAVYDPTNGLVSEGDIGRVGGMPRAEAVRVLRQ